MVVLNNFVIYFACTRMVRTLRAGLHGFPGGMAALQLREGNGTTIARRCASCAQAEGRRVCPAPGKPHTPARSTEVSRFNPFTLRLGFRANGLKIRQEMVM
ncbi:MAG: hypothetical protein WC091_23180 [Sulfuricellaceae bacterium]